MGLFERLFGERFPYTNFHDLNLDWVLKTLREIVDQVDSIELIKFADPVEWDETSAYESSTLVVYENSIYLSKKDVPEDTPITDTEYWELIISMESLVEDIMDQVETLIDDLEENLTEDITDLATDTANKLAKKQNNNLAKHLLVCGDS